MLSGIRKLIKGLFFSGDGSLSLARVLLFFVTAQITALIWLSAAWVYHVTITGQMETAAPLAQAVFGGVAAILSAQAITAAGGYISQMKWGSGGISGRQLDIDAARGAAVAGEPVPVVPDIADTVPSDEDEPRVAAEMVSTQAEPFVLDDPLKVELVEGDGK